MYQTKVIFLHIIEASQYSNRECDQQLIPTDSIQHITKEKDANLIIMNNQTHNCLGQMSPGSTVNKVIHSSDIPILVVPIN